MQRPVNTVQQSDVPLRIRGFHSTNIRIF